VAGGGRTKGPRGSRGAARGGYRALHISSPNQYQAKLTPAEVTGILRANEYTNTELPSGPVKSYDMNTLRSNNPTEDAHTEARLSNGGYLFGIYDGHGGAACGQVVAKRLLQYVAAGLLSPTDIDKHIKAMSAEDPGDPLYSLLEILNENFELVQDLKDLYQKSYEEYLEQLSSRKQEEDMLNLDSVLTNAFITLDNDMSREALPVDGGMVNMKTLTVAMSGCVAVVTHIDGPHLHVASTGDCTAVVGSLSETGTWIAKKLTTEHNSDNVQEVKRILSEHPESEHHQIIKGDRLLSILAPLRAFGDFKFKWPAETIESTLGAILGEHACPPHYKTPPYLTAKPEVTYHHLTARDRFLVLGSDGLWDMMTPMQVIRLVGEHMSGKVTLSPLHLIEPHIPLEDIASLLRQREAAMKLKPTDANAATHLIRCALGGTAYGVDHSRLSQMLSLPQDMVRMFRDDITITVVFFDDEYLRHC
jgi:pyruvate dehydrogenase phosphatase